MKKLSIWFLSILMIVLGFASCEVNEEFDNCPELAFTFSRLDSITQLNKTDDTIHNDSVAGYYKFIADFPTIQNTPYEWFVNDSLVDSELVFNDRDNMYVGFFEAGSYEVCIKSETPECPEGTSFCKTITIKEVDDKCLEVSFNAEENIVDQNTNVASYTFTPDLDGIEGITNFQWLINDQEVQSNGVDQSYSERLKLCNIYEVCLKVATENCPEGVTYCETIDLSCEEECPEVSFEIEQDGNSFGYNFYPSFFEGIDDPTTTLEWYDNEVYLGKSSEFPHNNPFYTQLEQGSYLICLVVKTKNCPEGRKWCKLLQVGDPVISCPELSFEIEQQGDSNTYMFFPGNFEGVNSYVSDWLVNGDYVGSSSGQQDPLSYEFNAGRYEVCLLFETPQCPEGIKKCVVVEITDPTQG